jgi:hypothetical protein
MIQTALLCSRWSAIWLAPITSRKTTPTHPIPAESRRERDAASISDEDDMEKECARYMNAHKEIKTKTEALNAVAATPRGKAILRRDRMKAGIGV